MKKLAEHLEQEIKRLDGEDAESLLAASAVDFAAYDSADLRRVAALLVGFADALDADGHRVAADNIDGVIVRLAAGADTFWNQPEMPKGRVSPPPRASLGPLGHSLLTRHSPDLPGVSLVREKDGVYRDPVTNKVYDFNQGFVLDDGTQWMGGSVSAQTPSATEEHLPVRQQIKIR